MRCWLVDSNNVLVPLVVDVPVTLASGAHITRLSDGTLWAALPDGLDRTSFGYIIDDGDGGSARAMITLVADRDQDGLTDEIEAPAGTDPRDADSDDDGVLDGAEPSWSLDSDDDGLINALDPDSDNDRLVDGTELSVSVAHADTDLTRGNFRPDADPNTATNPLLADTDNGGLADGAEDLNHNGAYDASERNPLNASDDLIVDPEGDDTDGDGVTDGEERFMGSNPNDIDSDDDGVADGAEQNPSVDTDGDGLLNIIDPDSDNDRLYDGTERGITVPTLGTDVTRGHFVPDADPTTTTWALLADSDAGGVQDGAEDANHNGAIESGELDPEVAADDVAPSDRDGDGLTDDEERHLGTNPDDADSDDDGLLDGNEPNVGSDTDGDGLINGRDPDSDNDGLYDGTEAGITAPHADTNTTARHYIPDADPATRTSPVIADSDGGGVADGKEDTNRNGALDAGERDPTLGHAADDGTSTDTDNDGLPDATEANLGTDPSDADSDDDGVLDGAEPNWSDDHDGDGLINPLDPDSDNDGLYDGTELGVTTAHMDTDVALGHFEPDGDASSTTSAVNADTDAGGVRDGVEDTSGNGIHDATETDPTPGQGADDGTPVDADGDGLSDAKEQALGTDPNDADSDDDGVLDGAEANYADDTDGDGAINALDPDSDSDGLNDGTELGVASAHADTDVAAGHFVADADPGTHTSMVDADSDDGGVADGLEDSNSNGQLDVGETDPTRGHGADDDRTRDTDGDGIADVDEGVDDADHDDTPNYRDLDSDGDTISDTDEAGDTDLATPPVDTDSDGTPDFLDADADNDTIADHDEAGDQDLNTPPVDTDGDGTADVHDLDTDGDSISDAHEAGDTDLATTAVDSDGDGQQDFRDTDSDGDSLSDLTEAGDTDLTTLPLDTDLDGTPDYLDPDSDNDTILDGVDNCVYVPNTDQADANQNHIGDACERDLDGDGVANGDDNCVTTPNADQADSNDNGQGDACEAYVYRVKGSGCSAGAGTSSGMWLLLMMGLVRRRRGVVLSVLTLTATASAQTVTEPGDFPAERFRWTFARTGLLSTESAAIPGHLKWDMGMWLGTANDPLVLYREDAAGNVMKVGSLVAQRTSAALVGSVALWRRLELGAEVPLIIDQQRGAGLDASGLTSSLGGAALGDIRLGPKLGLLNQARHRLNLAMMATVTLPTGGKAEYRGERGVTVAPELLLSQRYTRVGWALNLGYRLRPDAALADLTVDDELFGSAALGVPLGRKVSLALGAQAATAAASPFANRNATHLEALGGANLQLGPALVSLMGGAGVVEGFGTPDWRAVVGVRVGTVRDVSDRDDDGLTDDVDACPDDPEDRDRFQDGDGCPDPDNDRDQVLDTVDKKPLDPEDRDNFEDDDGAPDPDNDADGILDKDDQCPLVPETVNGIADEDGCPESDRDGDGIVDNQDTCPDIPEDKDGVEDTDGCVDDNDRDGIADVEDQCPSVAGVPENRGCPDTDRDGDQIVDRLDNCPDEAGTAERHGCVEKQLATIAAGKIEILDLVYFKTDKAEIQRRSFKLLTNVAQVILAHPELTHLVIEGHTDDRGDDDYNLDLSQRRAEAVVQYLISQGVAAERLVARGYGETKPIAPNASNRGRATNRRVEFKIEGVELRRNQPSETLDGAKTP